MGKKQKLFDRILNNPRNVHFDDLVIILQAFGFNLKRIKGSHHNFKHPDVPELLSIQPGKDGKAKNYQVKKFLTTVEEYDLRLHEDE